MRKVVEICLIWLLTFCFADSVSMTGFLPQLEHIKDIYLSQTGYFAKIQKDVEEKIDTFYKNLYTNKNFKILVYTKKVQIPNLRNSFMNDFLNLKSNFISDVNNINGQVKILDDKIRYGLITGDDIGQQIATLDFKVVSLSGLYFRLLSGLKNSYMNKIIQISGDVSKAIISNKEFLNLLKKREKDLKDILSRNTKMHELINRFSNLFLINQHDLYNFLGNMENKLKSKLLKILTGDLERIYKKNSGLKYCAGEQISNYINVLINNFTVNLENYFKTLVRIPYSKEDVEYIKNVIYSLEERYYQDGNIDYKKLAEDDYLDKIREKLKERINSVIKKISDKLAFYNFPKNKNDIKNVLIESLNDFLKSQVDKFFSDFHQFIKDKKKICDIKIKDEKEEINNILTLYYNIYSSTGRDIVNDISNLQYKIKNMKNKMILPEDKEFLQKIYWQLEIKKVDLIIKKDGLDRFDLKYPNIENSIENILQTLKTKFKKEGKSNLFKKKMDNAINKIDNILSTLEVEPETKYLLLKIKKFFIKYLYLK